MYIKLEDTTSETYYVSPLHIAYLKEGKPTGTANVVYKVVLNCGKQIILTEEEFIDAKRQADRISCPDPRTSRPHE